VPPESLAAARSEALAAMAACAGCLRALLFRRRPETKRFRRRATVRDAAAT
jgi:hypothetical protein